MDNALEQIRLMSTVCELHVLIELSPDSLKSTVVDFTAINTLNYFEDLQNIIAEPESMLLQQYIDKVSSVSYSYYPSQRVFGFDNMKTLKKVLEYISTNNFNTIHFDTISARLLPILPFLANKKIIATIHDPISHKGEKTIKKTFINWIYAKFIDEYLFYSIHALNQFLFHRGSLHSKTTILKLLPYTYISNFKKPPTVQEKYILFFGRISAYKGVDLLIDAADYVLQYDPTLKIKIAGVYMEIIS